MQTWNTITCCHRTHSWHMAKMQTQTLHVNKTLLLTTIVVCFYILTEMAILVFERLKCIYILITSSLEYTGLPRLGEKSRENKIYSRSGNFGKYPGNLTHMSGNFVITIKFFLKMTRLVIFWSVNLNHIKYVLLHRAILFWTTDQAMAIWVMFNIQRWLMNPSFMAWRVNDRLNVNWWFVEDTVKGTFQEFLQLMVSLVICRGHNRGHISRIFAVDGFSGKLVWNSESCQFHWIWHHFRPDLKVL